MISGIEYWGDRVMGRLGIFKFGMRSVERIIVRRREFGETMNDGPKIVRISGIKTCNLQLETSNLNLAS